MFPKSQNLYHVKTTASAPNRCPTCRQSLARAAPSGKTPRRHTAHLHPGFSTWLLGPTGNHQFGGPGGPDMPESSSNQWAASRRNGWEESVSRRGRLDPKNQRSPADLNPCIKNPSVTPTSEHGAGLGTALALQLTRAHQKRYQTARAFGAGSLAQAAQTRP
jgi:hypothetical protein